jgi:hypothetical protein
MYWPWDFWRLSGSWPWRINGCCLGLHGLWLLNLPFSAFPFSRDQLKQPCTVWIWGIARSKEGISFRRMKYIEVFYNAHLLRSGLYYLYGLVTPGSIWISDMCLIHARLVFIARRKAKFSNPSWTLGAVVKNSQENGIKSHTFLWCFPREQLCCCSIYFPSFGTKS